MLSVVGIGCLITATMALVHYLMTKSRLADTEMERVIAKKLSTSSVMTELVRLREDNAVMRNLLIDLVENETSTAARMTAASPTEQRQHGSVRLQRFREILAEAAYLLQRFGDSRKVAENKKVTSIRH
jgi:hypothetical protein